MSKCQYLHYNRETKTIENCGLDAKEYSSPVKIEVAYISKDVDHTHEKPGSVHLTSPVVLSRTVKYIALCPEHAECLREIIEAKAIKASAVETRKRIKAMPMEAEE